MSEMERPDVLTTEQRIVLDKFLQIASEITKTDVINFLLAFDIVNKQFAKNRYDAIKDLDEDHGDLTTLKTATAFHRLTMEEKNCIKNVRYYVGIHDIENMLTVYKWFFEKFSIQKK
jgi:hypothetical protein